MFESNSCHCFHHVLSLYIIQYWFTDTIVSAPIQSLTCIFQIPIFLHRIVCMPMILYNIQYLFLLFYIQSKHLILKLKFTHASYLHHPQYFQLKNKNCFYPILRNTIGYAKNILLLSKCLSHNPGHVMIDNII